MEPFETYEHDGFTIELHYDQDCESPRQGFDVGLFLGVPHRRYKIGDEVWDPSGDWADCPDCGKQSIDDCERCDTDGDVCCDDLAFDELVEHLRRTHNATVVLPVSLYDHSGVSYSVGMPRDRWDSGLAGFILDTPETLATTGFKPKDEADLIRALTCEIETYSAWANGECCGFVIKDRNGDEIDSCWGFYSSEDALDSAKDTCPNDLPAQLYHVRLTADEIRMLVRLAQPGQAVTAKLSALLEGN